MSSTLPRSLIAAVAILTGLSAQIGSAETPDFTVQLDLRLVGVNSPYASFTQGGLGLLRYDEDHDGLQLGSLMLDIAGPITETLRYTATAYATGDGDQNPIDLTEAYLEWRPYPVNTLRWRTRVGAFYPTLSLENRAVGWQSLYSISPSAINTWIGEEFRTIGAETSMTIAGAPSGRAFDISVFGALYGWNDPAGILIFQRGWGIHDRQTPLFGSLPRPLPRNPAVTDIEFFDEVDNRAGYYVGADVKWTAGHVVRALHYDNRGDTSAMNGREPTWLTRFDSLGTRLELPANFTFIAQYMNGSAGLGNSADGRGFLITDYLSWFTLLSYSHGANRYTIRYDRMETDTVRHANIFNSEQNAHAWTVAYLLDLNRHWQLAAEALRIDGSLEQRAYAGVPVKSPEEQLQVAIRFVF